MNKWLIPIDQQIKQPCVCSAVVSDWMQYPITVGDDQGKRSGCAIWTMAEWLECMGEAQITDKECAKIYDQALIKYKLPRNSGLTFQAAFQIMQEFGYFKGYRGIIMSADFRHLEDQPLMFGMRLTDAWHNVASNGCLDHSASQKLLGYHAVLGIRSGPIKETGTSVNWVVVKNHWTTKWGWNGIGIMTYALFLKHIEEIWYVV